MDATDIILENDDIVIKNGDIKVGLSDAQHVEHIMRSSKGQYYQHPLVGVGIYGWINSKLPNQELRQNIKTQLESDNYRVTDIEFETEDGFSVTVDAKRLK